LGEQGYRLLPQHVTGDFIDPLAWVHSKIGGHYDYTRRLFT